MDQDKQLLGGCVGIIVFVIGCLALVSNTTVNPGQAAIITKGGVIQGEVRGAGTYWELFANKTFYNLKTSLIETKLDAGSRDSQYVYVNIAFTYSLKSEKLIDLFTKVGTQEDLQNKLINPTLADSVKHATAQFTASEILPKQGEFRNMAKDLVYSRLDQTYITIGDLQITNIDFTPEYNKAIEQKQVAQQETEKVRYELEKVKIQAEQQKATQTTLTPQILQKMWIEKWDGKLPQYTGSDNFYMPVK